MRATEQSEKTLYLLATMMLVVLSWIVLSAFTLPSLRSDAGKAVNAYLVIANGRTQTEFFPARYIPQIQQLPGVESAAWLTIAGFFCSGEELGQHQPITINAYAGDIDTVFRSQALLWPVMGALAVGAVLVFIAITAHLVAQRRASMAVLQTLGFTARIQWFALALELASIAVLGTALGVAAGWSILKRLSPWVAQVLFTDIARPLDGALLLVAPAVVVLLALTLLWPAAQMAKLKPIDSLRI